MVGERYEILQPFGAEIGLFHAMSLKHFHWQFKGNTRGN